MERICRKFRLECEIKEREIIMAFTYENVTPTLIPNTTMKKRLRDGVDYQYIITPDIGYVIHDKDGDWEDLDGKLQRSYTRTDISCSASYDFTPLTIQIEDNDGNTISVTAYGESEFFAIADTVAPENNIFEDKNEPEVM